MTSAEQVRSVLLNNYRSLVVEDQGDGSAVVRDATAPQAAQRDPRTFPVSETLYRCADFLAYSGFAIVLVRDKNGVYLNAQ